MVSGARATRTSGLFVGLSTLDLAHFVTSRPGRNEKVFARETFIGAGGPATNAALTYSFLGGKAHLISSVGKHATGSLILGELTDHGVEHTDTGTSRTTPPLISCVVISADNGDRSIVTAPVEETGDDRGLVARTMRRASPDLLLVDGHESELALKAVRLAKERRIPIVFDGGRWKSGFATLLDSVDHALVSEGFRCPAGDSPARVIAHLHEKGVQYVAITRGHEPILYSWQGGGGTIQVPKVPVLDTLAAGDIFHGAYCFGFWGLGLGFVQALEYAAEVASQSCRYFGPRKWMKSWPSQP